MSEALQVAFVRGKSARSPLFVLLLQVTHSRCALVPMAVAKEMKSREAKARMARAAMPRRASEKSENRRPDKDIVFFVCHKKARDEDSSANVGLRTPTWAILSAHERSQKVATIFGTARQRTIRGPGRRPLLGFDTARHGPPSPLSGKHLIQVRGEERLERRQNLAEERNEVPASVGSCPKAPIYDVRVFVHVGTLGRCCSYDPVEVVVRGRVIALFVIVAALLHGYTYMSSVPRLWQDCWINTKYTYR